MVPIGRLVLTVVFLPYIVFSFHYEEELTIPQIVQITSLPERSRSRRRHRWFLLQIVDEKQPAVRHTSDGNGRYGVYNSKGTDSYS